MRCEEETQAALEAALAETDQVAHPPLRRVQNSRL